MKADPAIPQPRDRCPLSDQAVAYVQGELAGGELAGFDAHLLVCPACRKAAAEARQVIERLKGAPHEESGRDLVAAILSRIPADSWTAVPKRSRPAVLLVSAAAVLLLALCIGGLYLTHRASGLGSDTAVVLRAIRWLAGSQDMSGAWDAARWGGQKDYTLGLTGLALLAVLSDETTPGHDEHAENIRRGTAYVVSQQATNGRFGPFFGGTMYNHGIATVALLERYGLTKDEALRGPLDRAIRFIATAQTARGGWGYTGISTEAENTATTAWQLHALILARALGWEEAGSSIDRGLAWMERMVDTDGLVGYRGPGDFPYGSDTVTAMGAFCLFARSGQREAPQVAGGKTRQILRDIANRQGHEIDFYRSYFLSHAIRAADPKESDRWLSSLEKHLRESQVSSGPNQGSWEPGDRWSAAGGRIYSTALATLSLESDQRTRRTLAWIKGGMSE